MAIIDITKNFHDDMSTGIIITDKPFKILNQAALLTPAVAGSLEFKDDILYFTKTTALERTALSFSSGAGASLTYVDGSLSIRDTSIANLIVRTFITDTSLNTLLGRHNFTETSLGRLNTYVDASLSAKTSFTYVDASLSTLKTVNISQDSSLILKAPFTYVDGSLALKANLAGPTFTGCVSAGSFSGRKQPRIQSLTTAASITPNADTDDYVIITALAQANPAINAPSGTPVNRQALVIDITDDGTARSLASAWNAIYIAGGVALPTTTTLGKQMSLMFVYDSAGTPKWKLRSLAQE